MVWLLVVTFDKKKIDTTLTQGMPTDVDHQLHGRVPIFCRLAFGTGVFPSVTLGARYEGPSRGITGKSRNFHSEVRSIV